MISAMTKFFGCGVSANRRDASQSFSKSMPFLRSSRSEKPDTAPRMSLSQIKLSMELCIQDAHNIAADRLRFKIRGAREVRELWMLRSDAHELIAKEKGQQEAARAINALLPCFQGWLPDPQLLKI